MRFELYSKTGKLLEITTGRHEAQEQAAKWDIEPGGYVKIIRGSSVRRVTEMHSGFWITIDRQKPAWCLGYIDTRTLVELQHPAGPASLVYIDNDRLSF